MIGAFFKAAAHAVFNSDMAADLVSYGIHTQAAKMGVPNDKVAGLKMQQSIASVSAMIRGRLAAVVQVLQAKSVAYKAPEKPVLTNYVIEQHTTPKTNEAKRHWLSLTPEEKAKYAQRPPLLEKRGGYRSHWDIRIQQPGQSEYVSFATPKMRLPSGGDKMLWVQTTANHGVEPHNPPIIGSGYGMGVTRVLFKGKALVWQANNGDGFHISFEHSSSIYVVIPTDPYWENCLVREKILPLHPHRDRPFKMVDLSNKTYTLQVEDLLRNNDYIATTKYNGGGYTLIIEKSKSSSRPNVWLISRRPEAGSGRGIDKSMSLVHLKFADIPPQYYENGTTILYCEVYAKGTGGGLWDKPLSYSTSVLNTASPAKAELLQQKHGRLRVKVLDIVQLNGKDMSSVPYRRKLYIIQQIHKDCHVLRAPKAAFTYETKSRLLARELVEGEGIVLREGSSSQSLAFKVKRKESWDLKIVGIVPVSPSSPNSKWVINGEVAGSGCFILENGQQVKIPTDSMKQDSFENPQQYIGRYAEIEGQEMHKSTGKIYAPVFVRVHPEK